MRSRHRLVLLAPLVRVLGALILVSPLMRPGRSRSQDKPPPVHLRVTRRVSRSLRQWFKHSILCRQIFAGP
jgi:hypothetical protein